MFYLNVLLTVEDSENIAQVADALKRTGEKSRTEPGCERWEAYHSQDDPSQFLLVEWWSTKKDWEVHKEADAVQQIYLKEVIPLVKRVAHPSEKL